MLIAVNYHYVRPQFDHPYPGIYGVRLDLFERQLRLLGTLGTFVSPAHILAALDAAKPLPERAILITFDDGLREQVEAALPILDRLGIPAAFFINTAPIAERTVTPTHQLHLLRAHTHPADLLDGLMTQSHAHDIILPEVDSGSAQAQYPYDSASAARLKYLLNFALPADSQQRLVGALFSARFSDPAAISAELYMTVEQVRDLSQRGYLGSHGHEHVPLATLAPTAAERQVARASAQIGAWCGQRPVMLSYPFGGRSAVNREIGDMAAEQGIRFAFTMERAGNLNLRAPLHLARFDCNDVPGGKHFRGNPAVFFADMPARSWFWASLQKGQTHD